MHVVTVRSFGSRNTRVKSPKRSKCDDISSFVGVRPKKSTRRRQERSLERGKRGRIGFEWTQHSMFYRRSMLAECLRRLPLYSVALRGVQILRRLKNRGVGGVTSREARRIRRAFLFSLFISSSSGTSLGCNGGNVHTLLVPSCTTNFPLVILCRWSFRPFSDIFLSYLPDSVNICKALRLRQFVIQIV